MLIENLMYEIGDKKNSLKHINNYIIDEVSENWHSHNGKQGEVYDKITGLLHANLSVIESIEKILASYQEEINNKYSEFLNT